jgi:hypothetical protein
MGFRRSHPWVDREPDELPLDLSADLGGPIPGGLSL